MEDVLDLYQEPRDPVRPLVCMDEQPKQLVKETRQPWPAVPGIPQRCDYEYERNGTANVFMFVAPLEGTRHVRVTQRRTALDWAHQIRELVDVHYPQADCIRLVADNLNTHRPASLYAAFPPEEARRIARKLEIHYTPKHGSWLNIAEAELSVLTRQSLDRRIPDIEMFCAVVSAWQGSRNAAQTTVNWRFTTDDARIRLKTLYQQIKA